jgi:hypothetical protein
VHLKFLGVEWRPRVWNGTDGGGGRAGENEKHWHGPGWPSKQSGSFLWLDPASGEAPFTYRHPIKVARGRGTFSLFGAGRLDWF